MNNRNYRFRIGLFVLAALILLGTLITMFGALPTFFRGTYPLTVVFQDAPGIGPGTPVRRSGVRIGEVEGIALDNETGEVRAALRIEKRFTLRHNEQPTLVIGLIGGDTSIDFIPKKPVNGEPPDRSVVQAGEVLAGAKLPTVSTLLSQASEVVPATTEVLNDIRKSLKSLEGLTPIARDTMKEYYNLARNANQSIPEIRETNKEIQALARDARRSIPDLRRTNEEAQAALRNWSRLGERIDLLVQANQDKLLKAIDNINETLTRVANLLSDENQRNVAATLKNLREGTDNLPSITKNTDEMVKEARQTIRRLNEVVARADDLVANLQAASKPLATRGPSILKNVDESTEKLNQTLTDVKALIKAIGDGDGSLRRIISDPSLYNNLDEATVQVLRMLPRLDRILKDMEVFADKLARHPELLGAGGVVHPSSGLKEGSSSYKMAHP